jgi:hypothetical protein
LILVKEKAGDAVRNVAEAGNNFTITARGCMPPSPTEPLESSLICSKN